VKLKGGFMNIERFLELAKKMESRDGEKEESERLKRFFERFHILNRNYLDRETFEKAKDSVSSMAEIVVNTINFLDSEITRLRSKRTKLPFENLALGEMQRVQKRNEMLINDYLAEFKKE